MEKIFLKQGDVVYWCHKNGYQYTICWGIVSEQYSDAVVVDYIVPRERRLVNGIPINEFESERHYKKLPKGWSYNTKLFEITYEDMADEEKLFNCDITNPQSIKTGIEKGYLVRDDTIFHGCIEDEIDKNGYRIVKKYPMWQKHTTHCSIRPDKLYLTYEEAKAEVDNNIKELNRQANLSDYEWSVEQIDNTLNFFKYLSGLTDNEIEHYRNWLLEMDRVEDIEVRVNSGNLQWKYWKNKRWLNIELK